MDFILLFLSKPGFLQRSKPSVVHRGKDATGTASWREKAVVEQLG